MNKKSARQNKISRENKISFRPLTMDRWKDFETLFGEKGACAGCWCMYWRVRRSEYEAGKGSGNKKKIKKLVSADQVPGILLYVGKKVAGWCAVGPRENFPILENSRVLKRVDDLPVWSVTCFFIQKDFRRMGLTAKLLGHVVEYCKKKGAKIIEGYPLDVKNNQYPSTFAFTGFYSAFKKAGFEEAARRSETRPVMRYRI